MQISPLDIRNAFANLSGFDPDAFRTAYIAGEYRLLSARTVNMPHIKNLNNA